MTFVTHTDLTPYGRQLIKDKLIPALQSGEYAKGEHALRKYNGDDQPETWCCLGVICDLLVKDGKIPEPKLLRNNEYQYEGHQSILGEQGQELTGLSGLGGIPVEVQHQVYDNGGLLKSALAYVNDNVDTFEPVIEVLELMIKEG
jgi:hypothetical protein